MNKLEMAHECAMKLVGNPSTPLKTIESIVDVSWVYADAMQAEADKRKIGDAKDEVTGSRALQQTFIDGIEQPRYSDEQWQPDWSQAPDDCRFFCVASNCGYGFFTNLEPELMGDYFYVGCSGLIIENHGYTGDWRNSLRKRP